MQQLQRGLGTLQDQLEQLLSRIRDNDAKQHRFHALEESLLALNSLRDLITQTLNGTRATFDLESVSLTLVDEARQVRVLLRDDGVSDGDIAGLRLVEDPAPLQALFGADPAKPYLGCLDAFDDQGLFSSALAISDGSVAVLPLVRRGKLLGSLNLVSRDRSRFEQGMATDFQGRLSQILAVCLENTVNFELLRRASLKDMLTGVNNRRFFDQRLDEEINRVMRSGECLSCLFLDIDHFKRVNDTFGHQAGDLALVAAAHCIRGQLRNNDVLARYGGEEFVALLSVTSEEGAIDVGERIRGRVEAARIRHSNGEPIRITLSVGIATLDPRRICERSGEVAGRLLGLADQALYRAKETGRNRVLSAGLVLDEDSGDIAFKPAAKRSRSRRETPAETSPQTSFNW